MFRDNKGITLATLVITIIVLAILGSVATVSGIESVKYIKFKNAKIQFQTMQSHVNAWYEEYKSAINEIENDNNIKDEDKENKKTEWLNNYGKEIIAGNCDVELANTTAFKANDTIQGYRYFKSDYIKNDLDIDGITHDFLINIPKRTVLLYGGIEYQDEPHYSAEDFGINIVKFEEIGSEDKITFAEPVIQDNKIIIYNIIFPNNMSVSKYNVQYKLSDATNWSTLTSDKKGTYTDTEGNIYNDAWTIACTIPGTYKVKVTTASEDIKSGEEEITITLNISE